MSFLPITWADLDVVAKKTKQKKKTKKKPHIIKTFLGLNNILNGKTLFTHFSRVCPTTAFITYNIAYIYIYTYYLYNPSYDPHLRNGTRLYMGIFVNRREEKK